MNHYRLISLLIGVVAVADAAFEDSKNFIHTVQFDNCGADGASLPTVGVSLNVAEAGDFTLHYWNEDALVETFTIVPAYTVAGQVTVDISSVFSVAANELGGAFYLVAPDTTTVVDCVYWVALPPNGLSQECIDVMESATAGDPPAGYVYSLAPTLGAYVGEVKSDYTAAAVEGGDAVCVAVDPSATASFAGSNTATAFVNEVYHKSSAVAKYAFEVAVLGAAEYTLFVGDGLTTDPIALTKDVPAGDANVWNFLEIDVTAEIDTWVFTAGYAVLAEKTGEILSSITWGATPVASVVLDGVTVYPLVVSDVDLAVGSEALAVTGTSMEDKSTGSWEVLAEATLTAANTNQDFVAVPPVDVTVTPGDGTTSAGGGGNPEETVAPGETDAPGGGDKTDAPGGGDKTDAPGGGDKTDAPGGGDKTDAPGG
eukprot:Selendium_serpulae@DN6384_c6_g1_i7.p1